jgi:hypothetical protein
MRSFNKIRARSEAKPDPTFADRALVLTGPLFADRHLIAINLYAG